MKSTPNNNKNETIESDTKETSVPQVSPSRPTNGSSTLPPPTSPDSPNKMPISGYQTLDVRTLIEVPNKSPALPNKRILQLKATGRDAAPITPHKTDSTPKKQIYVPSVNESQSESVTRPSTLELASNANQITIAPDKKQATSPLTRKGRTDNDVTRVRRTSSVSKHNKNKKKKKKKLMKRLKKKKKSDRGKETSVLEGKVICGTYL